MYSRTIYTRSPVWLQEALLSTRELGRKWLREGGGFHQTLNEIEDTQWLNQEAMASYQLRRLQELISLAESHTPYYRHLFRKIGVRAQDFQTLDDISKIPYLSKRDVADNPRSLVREDVTDRLFKGSTSGTTGTPLTLYQNLSAIVREHAFICRLLRWTGFRFGERRAWIRGDMVVPAGQQSPPFWRMNRPQRMLMLSSYHLSERNAGSYIQALEQFDPALIQAYPTSVGFLAAFLDSRARTYSGSSLRAIVASSETLTPETKVSIERSFGCPVFDHYGSFERVVFISSCERGRLHVHPDYGHLEVLADSGTQKEREIVGTGFNNSVMPLLRYKTGDGVVMADSRVRCSCERWWPIVERVEGRKDDYVITKDGRCVTRLGHIFTGVPGIGEGQIIQDQIGKIKILVVAIGASTRNVEDRVLAKAAERFGPMMDVDVKLVPAIAREKSGKLRTVVRFVNL